MTYNRRTIPPSREDYALHSELPSASHGAEPAEGADAPLLPCPFCGAVPAMVDYIEMDSKPAATIDCRECDQAGTLVHPSIDSAIAAWNRRASPIKAEVTTGEAELRKPDGYAYRYKTYFGDCIMFNGGEEYNLSKPIETIPYWLGTPPESANASLRAKLEEAERNGMEIAASLFDGFTWGPYKHPSIIIREAIAARQSAQAASQP